MHRLFVVGFLSTAFLAQACQTTQANAGDLLDVPVGTPENIPAYRSVASEASSALVDVFYGTGAVTSLPLLTAQAEAAAQNGDGFEVHEVLGAVYDLQGDDVRAWRHFLKAAADLRNPNPQYALGRSVTLWRDARMQQTEVAILKDLFTQHEDPSVRAYAANALMARQWHLEAKVDPAVRSTLPLLERFSIIGPFDNDQGKGFLTVYPPEADVSADHLPGKVIDVSWRDDVMADPRGTIRIGDVIAPDKQAVAYLKTYVFAEAARAVELRLSTDAPVRVLVNEQVVANIDRIDAFQFDNVVAKVALQKGWNLVLIKSANEEAAWMLRARFTTPNGAPLAMVHKTEAEATTKAKATPPRVRFTGVEPADVSPRSALHYAYDLSAAGHKKLALDVARPFDKRFPDNLYAQYLLTSLLRHAGEEGQAIDRIEKLVADPAGTGARFALARVAFFQRKGRYDRALRELDALPAPTQRLLHTRMRRAALLTKRGWHADACRELSAILVEHPSLGAAHTRMAQCADKNLDPQQKLAAHLRAAGLAPGHVRTNMSAMLNLVQARRYDEAAEWSTTLERRFPDRIRVLIGLAFAHRRMGDSGRAAYLLEKAQQLAPGGAVAPRLQGEIAYLRGDTEAALVAFRAAYERDPSQSSLLDRIDYYSGERDDLFYALVPDEKAVEAAIAQGRAAKPLPGSHRIFLLDDDVTRVARDGSTKTLVTIVQVALDKKGRDALIQQRYPSYRSKLLQAFVVQPDGSRQEASSVRGGNIRFRKVEAGSVSVVQYEHSTRPGGFLPNHYAGTWMFQGVNRSLHRGRWVVLLDGDRPLHTHIEGPVQHKKEVRDGRTLHTFTGSDIGPIVPEPMMPPLADVAAKVSISTVSGWDEYVRWERALLRDAFESNAELEKIAQDLTSGTTSERERFDRLYRYVADEIRYQQDYENTIAGVRPHACPVVLERGYGDCKDKAVLLMLLGEHVGLDIDFAILRTRPAGAVIADVPNQQFNHAIVYVPAQGDIPEGFFMDPTTDGVDIGSLRADDQGATSLVLDPKTGTHRFEQIPFQSPELEQLRYLVSVNVGTDLGAEAEVEISARGNIAGTLRRAMREKETTRRMMERSASSLFAGSSLRTVDVPADAGDITKPLSYRFTADVAASVTTQKNARRVKLPTLFIPFASAAALKSRTYPVRFNIPAQIEQTMMVKLPPGYIITNKPVAFNVEHACFTARREVTDLATGELKIRFTVEERCHEVAPEAFEAFRNAAIQVLQERDQFVTFRPTGAATL